MLKKNTLSTNSIFNISETFMGGIYIIIIFINMYYMSNMTFDIQINIIDTRSVCQLFNCPNNK